MPASDDEIRPGTMFSRTSSLSLTLAPPITAANGRSGFCRTRVKVSSPFARRSPATAGRYLGTPTIEAWARWEGPKASLT